MVKRIRRIVVTLIGLAVLAAVGGYLALDVIAARAIERGGRYAMGVPTRVARASVRPWSGTIALSRLRVDNPEGFDHEHFLVLDDVQMVLHVSSLMRERVVVPRLALRGLRLNIEHSLNGRGNYQQIIEHLRQATARDQDQLDARRYHIGELLLTDISIAVDNPLPLGPRAAFTLRIDEIRLDAVDTGGTGGDEGLLMSQLCEMVVAAIVERMATRSTRMVPTGVFDQLKTGFADREAGPHMDVGEPALRER